MKELSESDRTVLVNKIAYYLKLKDYGQARAIYRCIVNDYDNVRIADEVYGAARKLAVAS